MDCRLRRLRYFRTGIFFSFPLHCLRLFFVYHVVVFLQQTMLDLCAKAVWQRCFPKEIGLNDAFPFSSSSATFPFKTTEEEEEEEEARVEFLCLTLF